MFVIDRNACVCCHNCACECPMQAIDFVGTKYQIDQSKCVQCGLCAKVCHTAACHEEPATQVPVQQHDLITLDADVVVVGSGSGCVAAVRAAQKGKKVILLEKSSKTGGNCDYAHAYFPVFTNWHKERGMVDCREEAIQHYRRITDNELEEDVLRAAVYGTGYFFDWMCTFTRCEDAWRLLDMGTADSHGPVYGPGLLDFPTRIKDNLNCRDDAIGPGWGGTHMKYAMMDAIEKQNLPVKILTSTAAEHLVLDDEGKICAVMARDPGGEIRINCKAVDLQCGGFGRNDEYLRQYITSFDFFDCETPIHRFSVPGDTGDGITMLKELGVEPNPDRMFISIFGPKHHPFNNSIADIVLEPEVIQVNCLGRRYMKEDGMLSIMNPSVVAQQPKEISWAIMSKSQAKKLAERYRDNPMNAKKAYQYATWEEDLEEEAQLDTPVKKAATLRELAPMFGADPDIFMDEIEKYNRFCAQGKDEDFDKPAQNLIPIPLDDECYYAVYGQRFSEAAMGGVTVNGKCQVLRNDGSIIPGLYAGGDATSAMHRADKLAVISELTWAVASGYTAGCNMAAYIDGEEELIGGERVCC